MLVDAIQSAYRRTWWVLVLRSLFAIAFGACSIRRPMDSIASFALGIALWALLSGIAAGAYAMMLPPATLAAIMGLISACAIVSGVACLFGAYTRSTIRDAVAEAVHPGTAS